MSLLDRFKTFGIAGPAATAPRNKDKKKTARCSMAITIHKKENARWSMGRNIPQFNLRSADRGNCTPRPSVVSMVKVFCVALKTPNLSVIIFGLRTSSQNSCSIRIRAVMCCPNSSQFGKRAVAAPNTFPFRKRERAGPNTSVFPNVLKRSSRPKASLSCRSSHILEQHIDETAQKTEFGSILGHH